MRIRWVEIILFSGRIDCEQNELFFECLLLKHPLYDQTSQNAGHVGLHERLRYSPRIAAPT